MIPIEKMDLEKEISSLRDEYEREMRKQMPLYPAGGLAAGAVGRQLPPFAPPPNMTPRARPFSLEEKMASRMDWGHVGGPWAVGFTHMAMQRAGEKVHIWIITKDGQSVVLEDEGPLFPSDALITKIRLMQQE